MFNFDVDKLVEKLEPAVAKVAEALGTGAEHLWTIGVTGQIAEGVVGAVMALMGIIVAFIGAKVFFYTTGKGKEKGACCNYCSGCWNCFGRYMVGGIIFSIALTITFVAIPDAVMHLVAPEWMLLQEVKDVITAGQTQ